MLPGLHQDAKITCIYYGFPDIIHWTKNSEALQDSNKFTIQFLTVDLESGLTTSMLTIYDVVTKDYGNYSCTATNSFGSRTITAEFKSKEFTAVVCEFFVNEIDIYLFWRANSKFIYLAIPYNL